MEAPWCVGVRSKSGSAPTYEDAPELAPVLARVPPEPRAFHAESAREFLTFVVRANMEALAARRG